VRQDLHDLVREHAREDSSRRRVALLAAIALLERARCVVAGQEVHDHGEGLVRRATAKRFHRAVDQGVASSVLVDEASAACFVLAVLAALDVRCQLGGRTDLVEQLGGGPRLRLMGN